MLGVAKIKKKLIALALLAVFVLVFILEASYGSSAAAEQTDAKEVAEDMPDAICPDGYVALSTKNGIVCAEKASFCGCSEKYIIVDGSREDVVCRDLEPASIKLGGSFI